MGKEKIKMNIGEMEESLKEVLHLNGEYLGAEVGGRANSQRDIKTLCHIMQSMCEYMTKQDWKIKVLNHEVGELKKCYTNTTAQGAKEKANETP